MTSLSEKLVLKFKLKTELSEVKSAFEDIVANCGRRFAENHPSSVFAKAVESVQSNTSEQLTSLSSFSYQAHEGKKRKASEMKFKLKIAKKSYEENNNNLENFEKRSISSGASSVASLENAGAECGNESHMNIDKMRQCTNLLKTLMNHPVGWVFNQPVDPVKLNIPDYFSIISRPMDLGTIKNKLARNQYLSTAEFAADIRLTFANAMRYNPPGNEVHAMAKDLNNLYNSKWRLLEVKWSDANTSSSAQPMINEKQRNVNEKKHTETKTWFKRPQNNSCKGGIGPQSGLASKKVKLSSSSKSMNSNIDSRLHDPSQTSSNELDFERTHGDYQFHHSAAYRQESMEASAGMQDAYSSLQINGDDLDYHVAQSNFDHSTPIKNALEDEVDLPCAEQLSPSKALRAAMLKSRFADTILKAQHRRLGEKVDPVKLQQEKKRLEKKQLEEKARLEAQVRAKEEAEARKQRDMEREAARAELLKIEKAAETFNYLANIGCPPPGHFDMTDDVVANFMKEFDLQYGLESPLEKLGLFMKKEDYEDEFDYGCSPTIRDDREEGEIHYS